MTFDIYDEKRRVGLLHLTNLCTKIQSVEIQYCIYYDVIHYSYQLLLTII